MKIPNLPEHASALAILNQVPLPTVTEYELRERFLGMLCGEVKTDELAAQWTDVVCNGRDSAVNVLNSEGKVIDRVPPLLMPYPTELKFGRSRSISAIVAETNTTNRINPIMGERFMQETLGKQLDTLFESEAVQKAAEDHRKSWVDFLARWGKKIKIPEGAKVDAAGPDEDAPTDFEEF